MLSGISDLRAGKASMKAVLVLFLLAASTTAAFAQGKVSLQLDQPILMGRYLFPADFGLVNQPVPTSGPLPSGVVLAIGLYGGTSSTSLALLASEPINPPGGTGNPP